ncbi:MULTISPECIES: hypothetical protein [unclassified Microcoleus]
MWQLKRLNRGNCALIRYELAAGLNAFIDRLNLLIAQYAWDKADPP